MLFSESACCRRALQKHGEEGGRNEKRGIREQSMIAYMLEQETGKNRGDDLRRHGKGIVKSGEFTDIAALAHFNHHRIGIDIDGRPGHANQGEQAVDPYMVFLYGRAQGKHGGKQHYTAQNRFLRPMREAMAPTGI